MSRLLKCKNGHTWEFSTPDESSICPVCGNDGDASTNVLPETERAAVDDLPPAPKSVPHIDVGQQGGIAEPSTATIRSTPTLQVAGYRIIRELGRGGMGVVYEARQDSLDRRVALKMIRAAEADAGELSRFRTEAEAAAQLQHPNIVQVFEVSEHDGRPFLSLEFVAGGSLAELARRRPLPPRIAARLCETLARAIQHAHEKGVVHRDLKPANILLQLSDAQSHVNDEFESLMTQLEVAIPKIADFGLAKRIDQDSALTRTGAAMGTPSYMAPEQAIGDTRKIGPLTDVYAIGATLYELLTGTPPFQAATVLDTLDQVRTQEPLRPRQHQPRVPRDLETICLKCLEKDARRRYRSAVDLADDLQSFREGRPIQARPVSIWQRCFKWARRRPAVAASIGVAVSAVLIAATVGVVSYVQVRMALAAAERNLNEALVSVDRLAEVANDRLGLVPRMEQEQQVILEEAVRTYERFLKEREDDPIVLRGAASAYRLLAGVERELANVERAGELARKSLVICRRLLSQRPGETDYQRDLQKSLIVIAHARYDLKQHAAAEESYLEALRLAEDIARRLPQNRQDADRVAAAHYSLGLLLNAMGRFSDAKKNHRQAIRLWTELTNSWPAEAEYHDDLGAAYQSLGAVLHDLEQFTESRTAYETALTHKRKAEGIDDDFSRRPDFRVEVARIHYVLGDIAERQDDAASAERHFLQEIQIKDKLARDYPAIPAMQAEFAQACSRLSRLLKRLGRHPEANQLQLETIGHWQKLADRFQDKQDNWEYVARSHDEIGMLHHMMGDNSQAEDHLRKAVTYWQNLQDVNPSNPGFVGQLAGSHSVLADVLQDLGRNDDAEQAHQRVIELLQQLYGEHPNEPAHRHRLAQAFRDLTHLLRALGRYVDAESYFKEGSRLLDELVRDYPDETAYKETLAHFCHSEGRFLIDRGKDAEAENAYQKAISHFREVVSQQPENLAGRYNLATTCNGFANVLIDMERANDAIALFDEAITILDGLRDQAPHVEDYLKLLGMIYYNRAGALDKRGGPAASLESIQRAIEIYEQLVARSGDNPEYRDTLSACFNNLGWKQHRLNRPNEAEENYRRANAIQADLARQFPQRHRIQADYGAGLNNLACLIVEQDGNLVEARRLFQEGLEHGLRAFEVNPDHPTYRRYLRHHYHDSADLLVRIGEHAEAVAKATEFPKLYLDDGDEAFAAARIIVRCIGLAKKDPNLDAAERDAIAAGYSDLTMRLLSQAEEKDSEELARLSELSEFEPLNSREDFVNLVERKSQR